MGACYEFYHFMLGKYKAQEYLNLAIGQSIMIHQLKIKNFLLCNFFKSQNLISR
jgi:hypothetical protein